MARFGITIKDGVAAPAPLPVGRTIPGLVGFAQDATAEVDSITLVQPTADLATDWGTRGSIPAQLRAIFANVTVPVIVYRLADPQGANPVPADSVVTAGIQALADQSEAQVGFEPHLLAAPELTWIRGPGPGYAPVEPQTASAVVSALETAAESIRGQAIVGSPPGLTTAQVVTWGGVNKGNRIYAGAFSAIPTGGSTAIDGAGAVMGVLSRIDPWQNPSMKRVYGFTRPAPVRSFHPLTTVTADIDTLQTANLSGIAVRNGLNLIGSVLNADGVTTAERFISVQREKDDIIIHLVDVGLPALGENVTPDYADNVVAQVQAYIDRQVALGALTGGSIAPDTANNTPANLANGVVSFLIVLNPSIPGQELVFSQTLGQPIF